MAHVAIQIAFLQQFYSVSFIVFIQYHLLYSISIIYCIHSVSHLFTVFNQYHLLYSFSITLYIDLIALQHRFFRVLYIYGPMQLVSCNVGYELHAHPLLCCCKTDELSTGAFRKHYANCFLNTSVYQGRFPQSVIKGLFPLSHL